MLNTPTTLPLQVSTVLMQGLLHLCLPFLSEQGPCEVTQRMAESQPRSGRDAAIGGEATPLRH